MGDLTDDDSVDADDALVTLTYVADFWPHAACGPYDVDCDDDLDAVDALSILRYVAAMPYTQVEPCPDIGTPLPP